MGVIMGDVIIFQIIPRENPVNSNLFHDVLIDFGEVYASLDEQAALTVETSITDPDILDSVAREINMRLMCVVEGLRHGKRK
jgi:hypothetical protein